MSGSRTDLRRPLHRPLVHECRFSVVGSYKIERNKQLPTCQAHDLLDALDEPPSFTQILGNLPDDCG